MSASGDKDPRHAEALAPGAGATGAMASHHVRPLLGWLGDSEQQLQLALDAVGMGIWHWNLVTGEMLWSRRCRALMGIAADAPISYERFLTLIHPADREKANQAVTATLQDQAAYALDFRVTHADGRTRWLQALGRTHCVEGQPRRMSGVIRDVTEAHLAAQSLVRQKQEFLQLVEAAPMSVAKLDRNLCLLALNSRCRKDLRITQGITDADLIGRSLMEILPEISANRVDVLQRALAGETLSGENDLFKRADGTVDVLNWHVFPWVDERGDIGGVIASTEVLTRQHQLEDRGRLWASAFTHNSYGMAIVDPVTRTLRETNAAYARLTGYTREELAGRDVLTLYPGSEHETLHRAVARADAQGSATAEVVRCHKDGTLIPTLLELVSVRDSENVLKHRIATVTDLRERHRVEAELRHQETQRLVDRHFRLVAHSAPIGIVLADADGSMTFANPAWLAITAIPLDKAVHRCWFDLVHADDRPRVVAAWRAVRDGTPFESRFRYRRPTGEARWVQAHATELKDAGRRALGYVCTCLDVTEQLQERAAADRFHRQVRSLAQRLQQMREVERAEIAGALHQGVYQGLTQIKADLLELAKPGAMNSAREADHTRLAAIAEATLEGLRHVVFELTPPGIEELGFAAALERYAEEQAARSGVGIVLSLPAPPLRIPQQILNVFYAVAREAIANALEHAAPRRVEVSVDVRQECARMRIADDGVGMGDQDREKPGCFGLLAAVERLAQIGGTLRTLGLAGLGTRVEASVPLAARPSAGGAAAD